jgi:hypothetical protein
MDRHQREARLIREITDQLPDFVQKCQSEVEVLILHQDAFAADYQDAEYALLGKAIKFAGICGKVVHVIGENRRTLGETAAKPS